MNWRVWPLGKVMLIVFALGAVDLARFEALEIINRLADAVLELSNRCLVVSEFQKLLAGKTSRRIGGVIGRRPHLAR